MPKDKRLAALIDETRNKSYQPQYRAGVSDATAAGKMVSQYLEWTPEDVVEACVAALAEANMHSVGTALELAWRTEQNLDADAQLQYEATGEDT